ncbi:MAG: hypothetical protein HFJ42_00350 [Clostridia bacterium]|nr:hypothetical protein [Clostridia bacterium]
MRILFSSDELVEVTAPHCGTWNISKKSIADFLILKQREEYLDEENRGTRAYSLTDGVLERAVILSNLTNISSIEMLGCDIIKLHPVEIKMLVSKYIIEFLRSK